jgi:hypothetical protein
VQSPPHHLLLQLPLLQHQQHRCYCQQQQQYQVLLLT